MAKRLNTHTPEQLADLITKALHAEQDARFKGDHKAADRHAAKAAKLGRVRAEVLTMELPFETLARSSQPQTAKQHNAQHFANQGTAEQHNAQHTGEVECEEVPRFDETQPQDEGDESPGVVQHDDTRLEAMLSSQKWAKGLRKLCLKMLLTDGPATADEISVKLKKSPFAIRPRFSELKTIGAIRDTGERRNTVECGKRQVVWAAL